MSLRQKNRLNKIKFNGFMLGVDTLAGESLTFHFRRMGENPPYCILSKLIKGKCMKRSYVYDVDHPVLSMQAQYARVNARILYHPLLSPSFRAEQREYISSQINKAQGHMHIHTLIRTDQAHKPTKSMVLANQRLYND